jgi:hypothetical protein
MESEEAQHSGGQIAKVLRPISPATQCGFDILFQAGIENGSKCSIDLHCIFKSPWNPQP